MTQALLLSFSRIAESSCWSFLIGLSVSLVLVPVRFLRPLIFVPLSLLLGLGILGLVGIYQLHTDHALVFGRMPVLLWIGASLVVIILAWRRRAMLLIQTWRSHGADWFVLIALGFATTLGFWPSIKEGGLQTYRVGPDFAGYAITAQYLRDGGSRPALREIVLKETAQARLDDALRSNVTMLNFTSNVAAEFILKSQRAGYPAILAQMGALLNVRLVVEWQLLLLWIPLFAASAVFSFWIITSLGVSRFAASLWGAGLALNCNLLNVLLEGQHAQIFAFALAAPLFVIWYGGVVTRERQSWREGALALLLLIGIFSTYSECFVVLAVVWTLAVVVEVVEQRSLPSKAWWLLPVAAVLSVAVLGPYSVDWVSFIIKHVRNISSGGGGFWQPQWASPVDVLGYSNIYETPTPAWVGRSGLQLVLHSVASGLVLLAFVFALRLKSSAGRAFMLAPLLFSLVIFAKSYLVDGLHNYNYMKSYTLVLFPLLMSHAILFYEGGVSSLMLVLDVRLTAWKVAVGGYGAVALVVFTGLGYVVDYDQQSQTLPRDTKDLSRGEVRRLLESNAVLLGGQGGIGNFLLGSYFSLNWLNLGWADPSLQAHTGKRVLFVARKDDLPNATELLRNYRDQCLFENKSWVVIDVAQKLDGSITPSTLPPNSVGPRVSWPIEETQRWNIFVAHFVSGLP